MEDNKVNNFDFFSQYIIIRPTVFQVLLEFPETRDNDMVLITKIWDIQSANSIKTYQQFKDMLILGKLAIPETIRRSRQKIQEENVSLRGKSYEKRKAQEIEMSKQIKLDF
jgi:hypothetical protein